MCRSLQLLWTSLVSVSHSVRVHLNFFQGKMHPTPHSASTPTALMEHMVTIPPETPLITPASPMERDSRVGQVWSVVPSKKHQSVKLKERASIWLLISAKATSLIHGKSPQRQNAILPSKTPMETISVRDVEIPGPIQDTIQPRERQSVLPPSARLFLHGKSPQPQNEPEPPKAASLACLEGISLKGANRAASFAIKSHSKVVIRIASQPPISNIHSSSVPAKPGTEMGEMLNKLKTVGISPAGVVSKEHHT